MDQEQEPGTDDDLLLAEARARGEAGRLAALIGAGILDTAADPAFDALAREAARLCETPVAVISLIDADRQWFKSLVGCAGLRETPRAIAFCDHTIRQDGLMVVPDLAADPRFAANPLVTGLPHARFYAGAPLTLPGGIRLGSLGILDLAPRDAGLNPAQQAALAALAERVVLLLAPET